MMNKYCARCGKRIDDNPGGLRKYCPDCAKAVHRQQAREGYHRRKNHEPVPKAVCERCGVEYEKTGNRQRYCADCWPYIKSLQDAEAAHNYRTRKRMETQKGGAA